MWNPFARFIDGDVTVPIPGTSLLERIPTMITDFIIRYPVPVIAAVIGIAVVVGWRRGGVFKGILIGAVLVMVVLFLMRAAS